MIRADKFEPSGLFRRGVAFLLDVVPITMLVFAVFSQFTNFSEVWEKYVELGPQNIEARIEFTEWKNLINFVSGIIYIVYASVFEASKWKATVGKKLLRIEVVNAEKTKLSMAAALKRNSLKILSAIPAMFGFLAAMFNKNRRTWHDTLAKAYVLKSPKNRRSATRTLLNQNVS